MTRYIASRLLLAVPIFLGVVTIVFVVVRILPGDPAQVALGDYASRDAVAALRQRLGLDRPIPFQYGSYLAGLVRGDLGTSLITGAPVRDEIAHNLPYTLQLTVLAMIVGALIGVPVGVVNALTRNRLPDSIGRVLSLLGLSVPAYYLGILLILLFAIELRALPAVGAGDLTDLADSVRHLILPAGTLGLVMAAAVARFTRSTVLNTLGQDFVRTARAKGLREGLVVLRHALPNALLPVITISGVLLGFVLGGSVAVEQAFGVPGLGRALVIAVIERDIIVVQNLVLLYAVIFVVVNVFVDLSYAWLDPRIRYG